MKKEIGRNKNKRKINNFLSFAKKKNYFEGKYTLESAPSSPCPSSAWRALELVAKFNVGGRYTKERGRSIEST